MTFSVAGVCLIAVLDSTVVFSLPLAVDIGVVLLSSHRPALFWFYALLVSVCSVFGTAITCYLGRRIGEKGLQRFVRPDRLKQISRLLTHNGEITMGALALIPPPFPFTAVVLAAGALGLNAVRFLLAVFGFRLVRFGSEAALAAVYGPQLVRWMRTAFFRDIGYLFIGLLIGASIISIIRFFISAHHCRVDARLCKQGGS